MKSRYGLFGLGVLLVLAGALLAHAIQTSGGVGVSDVRFPGAGGVVMSGLLYTPPGVGPDHPAPAVLVSHGYINTREMQSPFAIELARRGFVVLAMDMTGHGYSTGNVGANGFGGPAALAYLQTLPGVDRSNIGLEGHSLGGAPVYMAAMSQPQGYKATVLEGSSPGLLGPMVPVNTQLPRNLALVFGRFDEFAGLMWKSPRGSDISKSAALQKLFGTDRPVIEGKVYGEVRAGTARVLYNPPVTHPWEHFSKAGVGRAVDWFQNTLSGARSPRDPNDQIWIWKEVGTLTAFVGFVILMLGTFQVLSGPVVGAIKGSEVPEASKPGFSRLVGLAITAALPAVTFFPFMKLGGLFIPMRLFPQYIHNQLVVWALLNAGLALVLSLVLKARAMPRSQAWLRDGGIALVTVGVGYLALVLVDAVFKVDFRFWVLGLKPLDGTHFSIFLVYLVPWLIYFWVTLRALTAALPSGTEGARAQYGYAILAMAAGFTGLLLIQYGTLFTTGLLLTPKEPLNIIVAIQFVPLMTALAVMTVFTWRRTRSHLAATLICALVVSWYVTGGTAIHWSKDFPMAIPGAAKTRS